MMEKEEFVEMNIGIISTKSVLKKVIKFNNY